MASKGHEDTASAHSEHSSNSENASSFIGINTGCGNLNIRTRKGRNLHFFQLVLLPLLPIVALIIQNCISMESVIRYQSDVSKINEGVEATVTIGSLVAAVQKERLSVAYYVFTNGSMLRSNLSIMFANTNQILSSLPEWPDIGKEGSDIFESRQHFLIRLNDFRNGLDSSDVIVQDKMDFYTVITKQLIQALILKASISNSAGLWKLVEAYKSIIQAIENLGQSVMFGLKYYGRGHLSQYDLFNYVKLWSIANSGIKAMMGFSVESAEAITELGKEEYMKQIVTWDSEIRQNFYINGSSEVADTYLQAIARFLNDLRRIQEKLRGEIRTVVRKRLTIADSEEAISIAVLVLVLSISPVIILLVRKATQMVELFSEILVAKVSLLRNEKKRSDRLLYQMLPVVVAKQLKQKKQVPAESFESATVYFSDIVGFEELCAESSPIQIVNLLNSQYKVFDSRLEKYDVYKVETIGDAYMVVSGLPKRNGQKHPSEIACLALDLRHAVQSINIPHKQGTRLQIRAGVNTGPVVAGVVGTKMPRYCLFGDTVNTASRMETTCEPMRIQISLSTRMALMNAGGFIMDFRGYIDVKGKGEMATYWLEGRDGLQLQDADELLWAEGDNQDASPAFMSMVSELTDSPENKTVKARK